MLSEVNPSFKMLLNGANPAASIETCDPTTAEESLRATKSLELKSCSPTSAPGKQLYKITSAKKKKRVLMAVAG